MTAQYEISVTASDVGRRVTIRSVLPDPRPGARFTDVVGILERWADGELLVRRRDGSLARVAEAAIVAAKVVPAAPPGRAGSPPA